MIKEINDAVRAALVDLTNKKGKNREVIFHSLESLVASTMDIEKIRYYNVLIKLIEVFLTLEIVTTKEARKETDQHYNALISLAQERTHRRDRDQVNIALEQASDRGFLTAARIALEVTFYNFLEQK